jgi:hypothetical protein
MLLWWRFWANVGAWLNVCPPIGLFVLWWQGYRIRPVVRWDGRRWRMRSVCSPLKVRP